MSQSRQIQDVFSQNLLREDFNEISALFPTESKADGKFAIVIDTLGEYFLGTEKEDHQNPKITVCSTLTETALAIPKKPSANIKRITPSFSITY